MHVMTLTALVLSLHHPQPNPRISHPALVATTCFKSGEQTSGMNKICYYNCLGSTVAINVSNVSICPLSIER